MYRQFISLFCGAFLFFALMVGALVFVIDPLHYIRVPWYLNHIDYPERFKAPALAKSHTYDTVIIGSSMTKNFHPSFIDKKFGGKTIKLCMAGSTPREQLMILQLAIASGQLKRVIWSLDTSSYKVPCSEVRYDQGPFPFYLYENSFLSKLKYLYNYDFVRDSVVLLATISDLKNSFSVEQYEHYLDELHCFHNKKEFSFDGKIAMNAMQELLTPKNEQQFMSFIGKYHLTNVLAKQEQFQHTLDFYKREIIPVLKKQSKVEFYFFSPPYSIAYHKIHHVCNEAGYLQLLELKRNLYAELIKLDNVKLFDFQDVASITHNLNGYKDLTHYSHRTNEYIIESFATNQHLVDRRSPTVSIDRLEQQVYETTFANICLALTP
ncbi:MAG: hypothetical protein JSR46_03425 [Verrucomicrobia bacterium]|nr:hypothetical protein [Verrucomicrobiota bacterium]